MLFQVRWTLVLRKGAGGGDTLTYNQPSTSKNLGLHHETIRKQQ